MLNILSAQIGHSTLLAYIDGGTGSMLLQAAIAGVLTGIYACKSRFGQIKAYINNRNSLKHSGR